MNDHNVYEALHTTALAMDFVDRHLIEHPAIADNARWRNMAQDAHKKLFDLQQALQTEYL